MANAEEMELGYGTTVGDLFEFLDKFDLSADIEIDTIEDDMGNVNYILRATEY